MAFRIVQTRISGKRTMVLFRVAPFLPVFVPFIYIVLRLKNKAASTVKGHLIGIQRLYEFFENELNEDLDDLVLSGKFSKISARLDQLVYWLTYTDKVMGLRSREIYLGAVAEFLKWADLRYGKGKASSPIQFQNSPIKAHLRRVEPSPIVAEKALSDEILNLVLDYSNPDDKINPFREQNRMRNFIIIELLVWSGLRLGELAKLKTTDLKAWNSRCYVSIQDHENDPDDSRSDEPGLKNEQSRRTIAIHGRLYQLIQDYIRYNRRPSRNGAPMKLSHGYLLTSERGFPISKGTIRNVLVQLASAIRRDHPGLDFKLTPHSSRHSFANSFLADLIEIQGLSMERAKDELRTVCGWSPGSIMPNHYAKRYISQNANAHNEARMEAAYKRLSR